MAYGLISIEQSGERGETSDGSLIRVRGAGANGKKGRVE
jgi:hypothetical protein